MRKLVSVLLAIVLSVTFITVTSAAQAVRTIDSILYSVNPDRSLGETYSGWTRSSVSGNYSYFVDGIRVTGVVVWDDGERYCFNEYGAFMNTRSSENGFNIVFDNNYTVKLSDGAISFDVAIEDLKGKSTSAFSSSPYFYLYVLTNGEWVRVPYVEGEYTMEAVGASSEGIMRFSGELSNFEYEFTPGLYMVMVSIGNGEVDANGQAIPLNVKSEFNLVE